MPHPLIEEVLAYMRGLPTESDLCIGKDTCDQLSVAELHELQERAYRETGVYACLHIIDRDRYNAFMAEYHPTTRPTADPETTDDPMAGWFI